MVIATLWHVADLPTALLVRKLYSYILLDTMSVGRALAAAAAWLRSPEKQTIVDILEKDRQRSTSEAARSLLVTVKSKIEKHPERFPFRHPVYWAPFMGFGADN
jgi:CHAT domain-containing protein